MGGKARQIREQILQHQRGWNEAIREVSEALKSDRGFTPCITHSVTESKVLDINSILLTDLRLPALLGQQSDRSTACIQDEWAVKTEQYIVDNYPRLNIHWDSSQSCWPPYSLCSSEINWCEPHPSSTSSNVSYVHNSRILWLRSGMAVWCWNIVVYSHLEDNRVQYNQHLKSKANQKDNQRLMA